MNKVFLSGNLTRDPEVRYTQGGKAYARMGIAINRRYKEKESVDFFNLVAWEKTAEFCGRYLRKGSRVLVEGRLQTNSYENKDGVKVNTVEIWVDNIEFADSKRADSGDNDFSDNRPANNYSGKNYSGNRQSAPPRKNDYDDFGGGEIIDPEDTPF
ncbi:MAG: single-stranded DNA-binding protein [Selenomonadaceae bacterium]|nr:single-stranded DNA-binding protein [Selenomonadaceae bacterium]